MFKGQRLALIFILLTVALVAAQCGGAQPTVDTSQLEAANAAAETAEAKVAAAEAKAATAESQAATAAEAGSEELEAAKAEAETAKAEAEAAMKEAEAAKAEAEAAKAEVEAVMAEAETAEADVEARPNKVIFGGGGEPTTLDPHVTLTGIDESFYRNIYDGLIDWTGRPGEYEPALATEWEVAEDNMTWTFKLRQGVKFHDGTDFNAEVVKKNIDRALNSEEIRWRWEPFVESATVIDEFTIEIKSPKPHSGFLDHISWGSTVFHSWEAYEKYGEEDLRRNPVGTGPFIFEEWKPGEFIRLKRNPDYWREGPGIEELEYRVISEYSSRVLALASGDVDQIINVNVVDVPRIRETEGLKIDVFPSVRSMFLQPNLSKDLIAKKEVRQALNYAIDRDSIVNNLMEGLTQPSYSAFSSNNFGFKIPALKFDYDPDKARELLAAAGVEEGTPLTIQITEGRYYGDRQVGEALQTMFNDIGFETELWQLEWPTYAEYMWSLGPDDPNVQRRDMALTDYGAQDPNFQIWADLYSQGGDNWVPGGGNAYYNDTPELDEMIDNAWLTVDDEERAAIYAEMQDFLAEESLRIFIMEQSQVFAAKEGLTGFVALPNHQWSWRTVSWE